MHLALDHLTVGDAYPWEMVEIASASGFQGCCVFLESMSVLPNMPGYSLINDRAQRARMRQALGDCGVSLDLAYPFTLTGRSQPSDFEASLNCAAELGACAVNLLVYDRQPERATQSIGRFVEQAGGYGLDVVLEFYPASAIASLERARAVVSETNSPRLGINADILHLYRSGGTIEEVAAARDLIHFAQLADGPLSPPDDPVFEAAEARMELGQGEFELSAFVEALPPVKVSVEIPNKLRLGRTSDEPLHQLARQLKALMKAKKI